MDFISNEMPSMNNIYDSDYYNTTKKHEQMLANKSYEKAKNPFKTGVVPRPAYADMFMNTEEYNDIPTNQMKSLSGQTIPIEDFTHGNMQHFLKKGVTQNVNLNNNQNFHEKFGYNDYKTKKTEVESFFQPMSDMSLIKGMPNNTDFLLDRTNITNIQNNYNPIKSVRVGPGLNKGYTSEGSGGFQQADSMLYARPKELEDLRPKSDQRNTIFEIPIQAPMKSAIDKRAEVAPFDKNRPETAYKQTDANWFKGISYLKKDKLRPEENLKDTYRINSHIDYYGTAKNQTEQLNNNDNYGKNSILVYNTEKHELSKQETPIANITSVFKAVMAPITDALKITMKEYFVDTERYYGNAVPQVPDKQTTYDPVNHIMKTTIKETTIDDSENLNLTGDKETYSALYDDAKTTTKETTIHDSENLNLSGDKETYSALYDDTKTTTKQTTLSDSEKLNLSGDKETYSALYDETKKTTKQTTLSDSEKLNLSGDKETYSALYDETKTTVKETTIHDNENLNLSGDKETYSALYDGAKTTIKETNIHDDRTGNIKVREITYANNNDKAKKTLRQTLPSQDTKRNINNTTYYSTYVYDPKIVAKTTLKETTINYNNQYGFISGFLTSIFGGYLNKNIDFKNTQRQYSHIEYNGNQKSVVTHIPTDREADYNLEVDETRELIQNSAGKYIARGSGDYTTIDKKDINMNSKKQTDVQEGAMPTTNISKIYQSTPVAIKEENLTKYVNKNGTENNRLDSSILSSLIENNNIIKINPIRLDL